MTVLLGTNLAGCSAKSDAAENYFQDAENFAHAYLSARFNGSDQTTLKTPRKGFSIEVANKDGELRPVQIASAQETVMTFPNYFVLPEGGPYEFPNVFWADYALPSAFDALKAQGVSPDSDKASHLKISAPGHYDYGTYIQDSLREGADICPDWTSGYSARILFKPQTESASGPQEMRADIAVCLSHIRAEGGITSDGIPHIQTIMTNIQ